jgi:hypothetical protein
MRPTSNDSSTGNDDQLDRIVKADPLGFLFAIMEGKVLPSSTVKPAAGNRLDAKRARGRPKKDSAIARIKIGEDADHVIYAEFHSPSIADRERVAMFLTKLIARNGSPSEPQTEGDEFALLFAKRAAQAIETTPA